MTWQITDNQFDFSITHSIEAPQKLVYRVLADMESYPEFINDVVSVQHEDNVYHFVARVALLTIPATLSVVESPFHSIRFELIDGPVDTLHGSWQIESGDASGHTRVRLNIRAETGQRGQWLLRMTAKFVENKSEKLIAAFSNRVVELQQGGVRVVQPESAGGFIGWLKQWWLHLFGRSTQPVLEVGQQQPQTSRHRFSDEHQAQTLEALAVTLLPADDFDDGVQGLGFVGVVEMRARYETGRGELYATALKAVDNLAQAMFKKPNFVVLTPPERTKLLHAVRRDAVNGGDWGAIRPSTFFEALWEDTIFLYCTHPDTWQRIGFPGPSHRSGGYMDFDQVQEFIGRQITEIIKA